MCVWTFASLTTVQLCGPVNRAKDGDAGGLDSLFLIFCGINVTLSRALNCSGLVFIDVKLRHWYLPFLNALRCSVDGKSCASAYSYITVLIYSLIIPFSDIISSWFKIVTISHIHYFSHWNVISWIVVKMLLTKSSGRFSKAKGAGECLIPNRAFEKSPCSSVF